MRLTNGRLKNGKRSLAADRDDIAAAG